MRFQASVIGKIISYILVLILGAVLGLGGLVLAGYVFVSPKCSQTPTKR